MISNKIITTHIDKKQYRKTIQKTTRNSAGANAKKNKDSFCHLSAKVQTFNNDIVNNV